MGPVLTKLFPTSVRGAGQGFCYNFGRGIGAFFPTLVGILATSAGLGAAIDVFRCNLLRHRYPRGSTIAGDARQGAGSELTFKSSAMVD